MVSKSLVARWFSVKVPISEFRTATVSRSRNDLPRAVWSIKLRIHHNPRNRSKKRSQTEPDELAKKKQKTLTAFLDDLKSIQYLKHHTNLKFCSHDLHELRTRLQIFSDAPHIMARPPAAARRVWSLSSPQRSTMSWDKLLKKKNST